MNRGCFVRGKFEPVALCVPIYDQRAIVGGNRVICPPSQGRLLSSRQKGQMVYQAVSQATSAASPSNIAISHNVYYVNKRARMAMEAIAGVLLPQLRIPSRSNLYPSPQ